MVQLGSQRICPYCNKFESESLCPVCHTPTVDASTWKLLREARRKSGTEEALNNKKARTKPEPMDPKQRLDFAVGLLLGSLGFLLIFLAAYISTGAKLGF